MSFIFSKTGFSVLGLFVIAFFVLNQAGVFGNTFISLTLNSNRALSNGLVAHWTFDSRDVDGFQVLDRSGNDNHGSIVATTSYSGDTLIDAGLPSGSDSGNFNPAAQSVWISDSVGYVFYIASGSDVWVASTTDGGTTWGTEEITGDDTGKVTIWYDKWTPGDTGSLIHVLLGNTADDEFQYFQYDTTTDTYTARVFAMGNGTAIGANTYGTIVKTEGGTLYTFAADNPSEVFARCVANCTVASNWEELPDPTGQTSSDAAAILPIPGTENLLFGYWDISSAEQLDYYIYSATSSSTWGPFVLDATVTDIEGGALSMAMDAQSGNVYIAIIDDADDYVTQDHDIDLYVLDPNTLIVSETTNVVTNASGGLNEVAIAVDENRGHLYVAYSRLSTITDENTQNVYYKVSTDYGTTWSEEYGPINTTQEDHEGLSMSSMGTDRISVMWEDGTDDDLYIASIADLGDYEDEKVIPGNIGQGMVFDGIDDFVGLDSNITYSSAMTWAAWIKTDLSSTNPVMGNYSSGLPTLEIGTGGNVFLQNANGTWLANSNNAVPANEWSHVVVRWDTATSGAVTFFVDGESVPVQQSFGQGISTGAGNFGIGYNWLNYFDGLIDDVRVYNQHLATSTIVRLYELGATTKINQTLDSNPDLENGLVGHWSFDSSNVSGVTVTDESGSGNNGAIYATSTQAEVELTDSIFFGGSTQESASRQIVFTDADTGYIGWTSGSINVELSSTTDGGASWQGDTRINQVTGGNQTDTAFWYDDWTDGINTDLIHIAHQDYGLDGVYYVEFNPSTGELSDAVVAAYDSGLSYTASYYPSITRSEDGTLYVFTSDFDDAVFSYCRSNCTTVTNWASTTAPTGADSAPLATLHPIPGTDNIMAVWDSTAADLSYRIWSATSSSWWATVDIESDLQASSYVPYNVVSDGQNRAMYLVYADDRDDFSTQDHDYRFMTFDLDTYTWSYGTDVVTNASGGLQDIDLFVDKSTENLYAAYARRSTISDIDTADIYYRYSTDGGASWSGEQGPVNGVTGTLLGPRGNYISDTGYHVAYADSGDNDLQVAQIWDVSDTSQGKQVPGNIGQGLQFDGVDDYVALEEPVTELAITADVTVCAWIKKTTATGGSVAGKYGPGGNQGYRLVEDGFGASSDGLNGTYDEINASTTIPLGTWYHLCGTHDDTLDQLAIFTNGQSDGTPLAHTGGIYDNTATFCIGAHRCDSVADGFLNGAVDDVRVYNRVLADDEIKRIYELGATTKINKTIDTNPDLKNGLVAHYTFDGYPDTDISSTTAEVDDVSDNAHTGNAINFDDVSDNLVPGVMGQAMDFDGDDGTGDRITVSDHPDFTFANAMSVAMWIRPDDAPVDGEWYVLAKKRRTASDSWQFNMYNNSDSHYLSGGVDTGSTHYGYTGNTLIEMGNWYHVVMTWDGSEVRAYVDGVLDITPVATAGSMSDTADDVAIAWGSGISDPSFEEFDGLMDDIRLYDRALSAAEVTRLYELGN